MRIKVGQLRALIREELRQQSSQNINEIFGFFETPVGFGVKSEMIIQSQKLGSRCRNAEEFEKSFLNIMRSTDWVSEATRNYLSEKRGDAVTKRDTNKSIKVDVKKFIGTTKDFKKPEEIKAAVEKAKKEFEQKMMDFKGFMESGEFTIIATPTDVKDFEVVIDSPEIFWIDTKTKQEVPAPKKFQNM